MFIFLLFTSLAFGRDWDARSVKESTYSRDNTYCQIGKQKIQFQVRSEAVHTEFREKKYGDFLLFYYPDEQAKLLPLNNDKMHSYRLFEGKSAICSKSYAYPVGKDTTAILFLKENSPDMDMLAIQMMNNKTIEADKVIDTEYMTDTTEPIKDGFLFRTFEPRLEVEMGKTQINNVEYIFQSRNFPIWMKYNVEGFSVSEMTSYQKFHWKEYYKSDKDFFEMSAWNAKEKKFKNNVLFVAVNHKLKKECILLAPGKIEIKGNEPGWRCH